MSEMVMESIEREILIWHEAHLVGEYSPVSLGYLLLALSDGFMPLRRDFLYFLSVSSSIQYVVCQWAGPRSVIMLFP
jgi:hypothetical protein